LTSPPESGFGWPTAEAQATAIRNMLTATFTVNAWPSLQESIEDFMFERFVREHASRLRNRTDQIRLASAHLKAASHKRTFYMVYRAPEDDAGRIQLETGLRLIRGEFPDLIFLGLSSDLDIEVEEAHVFGILQTMLPLKT
jgi:hypothetical protein